MGYSDQKYITRGLGIAADSTVAAGTMTSSTTTSTLAAAFPLPTFPRRSKITYIKAICKTAPQVGATVVTLNFLNGTGTFGQLVVTAGTIGQEFNVAVTSSNTFGTGSGPTVTVIGSATTATGTYGAYELWFEDQELYNTPN